MISAMPGHTTRRHFLGTAAAPLLLQSQTRAKPNVLFIAIDDLNDWTSCLGGHPGARTPNLDRLAGRGVLFTNAHCAAPLCNPSRAAPLTGRRPSSSGVYTNNQPFRKSPVLKDAVTLPQHFMANGYRATGGGIAAPIVKDFLKLALADKPAVPFRVPPGLKLIRIDPKSGMRIAAGSPGGLLEAFKPGTSPPDSYSVLGYDGGGQQQQPWGAVPADSDRVLPTARGLY